MTPGELRAERAREVARALREVYPEARAVIVLIDAEEGVSTGVSAPNPMHTLRVLTHVTSQFAGHVTRLHTPGVLN